MCIIMLYTWLPGLDGIHTTYVLIAVITSFGANCGLGLVQEILLSKVELIEIYSHTHTHTVSILSLYIPVLFHLTHPATRQKQYVVVVVQNSCERTSRLVQDQMTTTLVSVAMQMIHSTPP
jgi:hypothetical protein